jgi:collagen type I/II/III/V/XI/XXIV/XXVII alpha
VRVARHAFGADRPRTDLLLSPDHAVLVEAVLIPIKCLINGRSIAQVSVDAVTYYHVELPEHDVLWADGLPAESYLDSGDRSNFGNGGEVMRLFPDFAGSALVWEARGYAPLVVCGPEFEAARGIVDACSSSTASAA